MIAAVTASLAAGLAAAVGLAAAGPVPVLVAAVGLVQVLVAARWFAVLGIGAAARGGAVVGALAAIGADLAVALQEERRPLAPVTAVLGLAMLAALLHQLGRRDGRDRLTDSLTATVSLAVVGALGSCYLGTQSSNDGAAFVAAGVAAAAVVVVVAALPRPRRPAPAPDWSPRWAPGSSPDCSATWDRAPAGSSGSAVALRPPWAPPWRAGPSGPTHS